MADTETPESLAELLSRLRKARRADERGLKDVAAAVGVSFQAIQRWETGEDRAAPDRVRRWLRAVDLPTEWADLYVEFRALEQLDALMERYEVREEYRRATRLAFRDGMRRARVRVPVDRVGPQRAARS